MVDIFSPAPPGKKMGPFSTSSPTRVYGKPETFNWIRLDPARNFQMTPCDIGLTGADKHHEDHSGWFIPHASESTGWQSDAFVLVNESGGYDDGPDGLSPVVRRIHNFWHVIDTGEWVCGPQLAYRKGETTTQLGETVGEQEFDAKRMSDRRHAADKVRTVIVRSEFEGTVRSVPARRHAHLRYGQISSSRKRSI
jgi:hypothetical protein